MPDSPNLESDQKGTSVNREQLNQDRQELMSYIQSVYQDESAVSTPFKPLSFFVHNKPTEMLSILYEPSLCVIVQGKKEVGVDGELFSYTPDMYLLASVHTPAQVRITEASPEKPYMGFTLTFSMEQIFDVLKDIKSENNSTDEIHQGLYFGELEPQLLNAVVRLVRTLDSAEQRKVLAPLFVKEILYFLMRGKGGDFIRHYIKDSNSTKRVVRAICSIKDHYTENLNVKELAEEVGMSESSLYAAFKKITTMSPLQFQKTLRLQQARQLLTIQKMPVSEVAFKVGYESPSQFSREYSRMYGMSPKADLMKMAGG